MFVKSTTNEDNIRKLADCLVQCSPGQQVTFAKMTRALGVDVLKYRYLLPHAFRLANEETGAVFKSVRGVGYERLENVKAPAKGHTARTRVRGTMRRTARMIGNAVKHANDISRDELHRAYSEITHLGLLEHLTYDRSAPKVPVGAMPDDPAHTARQTLEAMRSALGRDR